MAQRRQLFTVLAAAALFLLLLRPACELLPAHAAIAGEPASCCANLTHGDGLQAPDLAAAGPSGKALLGPFATSYVIGAALFAAAVSLLGRGSPPPRSFYARSARILR